MVGDLNQMDNKDMEAIIDRIDREDSKETQPKPKDSIAPVAKSMKQQLEEGLSFPNQ